MKYIDADKLLAEIERRIYDDYNTGEHEIDDIAQGALAGLIPFIDSLQQEQPNVDLEKGLADYCRRYYNYDYPKQAEEGTGSSVMPHIIEAAKYFYELGKLNARKED